ncbi:MAG: DNA repair protein RadC [Bacteroidetes bacterium]|nr:DNA repair protein RadC [Bacteroidota bacterium]
MSEPNSSSQTIKEWSVDDRPREKLASKGPQALTDAELLAILINSGTRKLTALDIARLVLGQANGSLSDLGRLSIQEFTRLPGIGEARAITIAAALELGRRRQSADIMTKPKIMQQQDAADILIPLLNDKDHEAFCVLYLNQGNMLIRHEIISVGGLTSTVVDVRKVLKNALLFGAVKMILSHNHPSGNPVPSQADKNITKRLKEAAALMDIQLVDHLIVAAGRVYSVED